MKTFPPCWPLLASTLLLCPVLLAEEPIGSPIPGKPVQAEVSLTGVIKEKTESTLIIKRDNPPSEVKVTLSTAVLITRGDRPGTLSDLGPGVRVTVKVRSKGETGEATSITILTDTPKPKDKPASPRVVGVD